MFKGGVRGHLIVRLGCFCLLYYIDVVGPDKYTEITVRMLVIKTYLTYKKTTHYQCRDRHIPVLQSVIALSDLTYSDE